jgi:hypothetical protein
MVDRSVSDLNKPGLSIRVLGKKAIRCSHDIVRYLKGSGFDINRHNLAMITFFDLRWRSLPEVIEFLIHRAHRLVGQILLCYIGVV